MSPHHLFPKIPAFFNKKIGQKAEVIVTSVLGHSVVLWNDWLSVVTEERDQKILPLFEFSSYSVWTAKNNILVVSLPSIITIIIIITISIIINDANIHRSVRSLTSQWWKLTCGSKKMTSSFLGFKIMMMVFVHSDDYVVIMITVTKNWKCLMIRIKINTHKNLTWRYCSTSPKVEPPGFCESMRATFR